MQYPTDIDIFVQFGTQPPQKVSGVSAETLGYARVGFTTVEGEAGAVRLTPNQKRITLVFENGPYGALQDPAPPEVVADGDANVLRDAQGNTVASEGEVAAAEGEGVSDEPSSTSSETPSDSTSSGVSF